MNANEAKTIQLADRAIVRGISKGQRGLYQNAIEIFDQAIAACQSYKGKSFAVKRLLARALGNKGAALGDFGRNSEAVDCYTAAIAIYRHLAVKNGSPNLTADEAVTVMNTGWALIKLGCPDEGFPYLHQALEMRRQLVADGCDWVRSDVARSLYNLGWAYLKAERYGEALPVLNEAAELLHSLIAEGEEGREEDLAYVLGARADTFTGLGRFQESLENCNEVCALFTRLALSEDNPQFDSALTTALKAREHVLIKLKETIPA